jgi:hypothetical protein
MWIDLGGIRTAVEGLLRLDGEREPVLAEIAECGSEAGVTDAQPDTSPASQRTMLVDASVLAASL